MHRSSVLALLLPSLLAGCSYFRAQPVERRVIMLSLDAGGQSVIDHLIADGAMPNLARLRVEGASAAYSRTNFPSKTAPGHAALWTGGFGDYNGITSNKVLRLPLADHTILETENGFDSNELLSEPIWITAARGGKRALVLQGTHVTPLKTYEPGGRYGGPYAAMPTLLDGYGGVLAFDALHDDGKGWRTASGWPKLPKSDMPVRENDLKVGNATWHVLAFDSPVVPGAGYDTLALFTDKDALPLATLHPGEWSRPLPVTTDKGVGASYFHLFTLSPQGDGLLMYQTAPSAAIGNKSEPLMAYYGANPFIKTGAIYSWGDGKLGKTMYQGGDGTAEERYLETVDFLLDRCCERARVLHARKDWDLAVSYMQFPDEALHAWYGTVDAKSPSYDPVLAPRVWKYLDRIGAACDRYIGALYGDGDTVLAVASDHGMAGLKWRFNANAVLQKAGLLKLDAKGNVDLAHTLALYPDTDGAFIVVNHEGHKGGIVPRNQIGKVLDRVETAMRAVKAHDGTPLVTGFIRPRVNDKLAGIKLPDGREAYDDLAIGGIRGGDLYLDLKPGYYFSVDRKAGELFAPIEAGHGSHVFDPRREDMHASLTLAGPGIRRGVKLPAVRNIDLAPTVTRILGLPLPARATGRVLEEALAE